MANIDWQELERKEQEYLEKKAGGREGQLKKLISQTEFLPDTDPTKKQALSAFQAELALIEKNKAASKAAPAAEKIIRGDEWKALEEEAQAAKDRKYAESIIGPQTALKTETPIPVEEKIRRGVLGFGEGATAGLVRYPQALGKAWVSGNFDFLPKGPEEVQRNRDLVKAALGELSQENKQYAQETPGAYYGGQIGSALVTAPIMPAKSLGMLVGRSTGYGATSGATSSDATTTGELAKDVGLGALAGGATGLVGGVVSNKLQNLSKEYVSNLIKAIEPNRGTMESTKATLDALQRTGIIGTGKAALERITNEISSAIAPAIAGGTAGAAAAASTGADVAEGAKYGAAGAVALTKMKVLNEINDAASKWAGKILFSLSGKPGPMSPPTGELGPYMRNIVPEVATRAVVPAAINPPYTDETARPRLRQLADDARERFKLNK